jgi:CBS domain-containing protein
MPRSLPVREVMTSDVVTLRPDQSVTDAAKLFTERRIGAAPVVDTGEKLVGMVSDDDLLASEARIHFPTTIAVLDAYLMLPGSLARFEHDLRKAVAASVADVMRTDLITVTPDDPLEQVATLMHERNLTHLPVVEGGRLVGIVARGDLVRALTR